MIEKWLKSGLFYFCATLAFAAPFLARADNYGDRVSFNIDKNYDLAGRAKAPGVLIWVGEKTYFYVDDSWWNGLDGVARQNYNLAFQNLDSEFSKNIYPKLTGLFGGDVNPAVNRDGKITILVHPMVKDAGGYISTGDGYSKYQAPLSNEREMVYFNTRFVDASLAKAYLAHEFTHLITFNQKDRLRNAIDDVWLNEARADYSSTILGYDSPFAGSNFDQRVRSFSADSSKSLVQWGNKPANYGAAHLFVQYLVDQYGIGVVADSMKTEQTGIGSIEYALKKNGFEIGFTQVFRNWLAALASNNCRLGGEYCYKLDDLQGFVIAPKINYLPNSEQVSLSVMYAADYFSGNWQKIIGGNGDLTVNFSGDRAAGFLVPYLLCYAGGGECKIDDLAVNGEGNAVLSLPDFGRQYASLTLMPFAAGKTAGFNNYNGSSFSYSFSVKVTPRGKTASVEEIARLMAQIEALKIEIARVQAILAARAKAVAALASVATSNFSCKAINSDLYFGVENYAQVVCLQEFLKAQGGIIYPNGAVTGRFSADTRAAVVRFQEKYAVQILSPLGLKSGTGYVGPSTRAQINRLLAN